jgi:hypothetical protein
MLEVSWKGKLIVSVEKWKQISGLAEIEAKQEEIESRPGVMEYGKINLDYPDDAWQELRSIKYEFKPEAMNYFPDGLIGVAAIGPTTTKYGNMTYWTCPGHNEELNTWISDYRQMLLELKGIYESEYIRPDEAKF